MGTLIVRNLLLIKNIKFFYNWTNITGVIEIDQEYYLSTTMEYHTNSGPPPVVTAAEVDADLGVLAHRMHWPSNMYGD